MTSRRGKGFFSNGTRSHFLQKRVQVIIKQRAVVITQWQIRSKESRYKQVVEQYLHFHRIKKFTPSVKMKGQRTSRRVLRNVLQPSPLLSFCGAP